MTSVLVSLLHSLRFLARSRASGCQETDFLFRCVVTTNLSARPPCTERMPAESGINVSHAGVDGPRIAMPLVVLEELQAVARALRLSGWRAMRTF